MLKAYDTILQSEVSADLAAQNGSFDEPYRYECSCCGEEVYIAASNSNRMVPHFRHRSGNNDVECENYLGQSGDLSLNLRSRRSNRERVEFYYDNGNKIFKLGIRYSADEISNYEQKNGDFEIRTELQTAPFYSLSVNKSNFEPDVPTLLPVNHFSLSYHISNTINETLREYGFFRCGNTPTFFKIQGNDDDFKAKLVRSGMLFTNIQYFVVFHNQYYVPQKVQFPNKVKVHDSFRFETMNTKFLGLIITIESKTSYIDELLRSWGYQLDSSETLTLLWPPSPVIDDVNVINSDVAFVFTSFDLLAHGNINLRSTDVIKLNHGISKVLVKSRTKIYKKNVEIGIDKAKQTSSSYNEVIFSNREANKFTIPNVDSYFLFNHSGVIPLKYGQVVFLTPDSVIIRYNHNYPIRNIYPCQQKIWTDEELLADIIMYYKKTEKFDYNMLVSLVQSKATSHYIDKCRKFGSINSVVKRFIVEGKL